MIGVDKIFCNLQVLCGKVKKRYGVTLIDYVIISIQLGVIYNVLCIDIFCELYYYK